jgi:hypothetical protein
VSAGGGTSCWDFGCTGLSIMGYLLKGKRGGLVAPASLGGVYLEWVKARGVYRRT